METLEVHTHPNSKGVKVRIQKREKGKKVAMGYLSQDPVKKEKAPRIL